MNTNLIPIVGGLLLLATTLAPTAWGHDDRGDDPGNAIAGGVSGRFVGSTGPALAINPYDEHDPYYWVLATGGMFCDLEVGEDSLGSSLNEWKVDGTQTGGVFADATFGMGPIPGLVEDVNHGFDDGGQGGACHKYHYDTGAFNTNDCFAGDKARASNLDFLDVFIGASCDWKEVHGGAEPEVLALCIINEVITIPDALDLIDCVVEFVDCMFTVGCSVGGDIQHCGADGYDDAINYGFGSGNVNPAIFPTNTGILNHPFGGGPCSDGPAAVFVFDTVVTIIAPVPIVEVHLAIAGDIWTHDLP